MHIRWRGLELPSVVECDKESLSGTYGKFSAEPFERGFGVTVGNSLRRILLSSLEGSAVTQIKIRGAQHEFSSIPGVLEDVTDIVLNVKALVVKNFSEQMKVITVEKSEAGPITGADIQTGGEVEIINQDHQDIGFRPGMTGGCEQGGAESAENSVGECGFHGLNCLYGTSI